MQYSINSSCHMVHYIHMTSLFHNWEFVLFDPFCTTTTPAPSLANHQFVLCICELSFMTKLYPTEYIYTTFSLPILPLTDI